MVYALGAAGVVAAIYRLYLAGDSSISSIFPNERYDELQKKKLLGKAREDAELKEKTLKVAELRHKTGFFYPPDISGGWARDFLVETVPRPPKSDN